MNEREAMAVLVSALSVSYAQREQALSAAGSAVNLLADPYAYGSILGEEGTAALRRALGDSKRLLDTLRADDVSLIIRTDDGYPARLVQTARPPHLLFCKGNPNLNDPLTFAIVGTRRADSYGLRHTRRIARELAEKGVPRDIIDQAYDELEEKPDEEAVAMQLAAQILREAGTDPADMTYEEKQKLQARIVRRLASRGFSGSVCYRAARETVK